MNRKIAAVVLAAAVVLVGGCSGNSDSATTTAVPTEESPVTTYAPQDLALADIPVARPPAGTKVEASALPEELQNFTAVPGLSPDQQGCINGAIKGAVDQDASVSKTPGKVASVGSKAVAVCDGGFAFTDQLVDGLAQGATNGSFTLTPEQSACLKQAFNADKDATAKIIGTTMVMQPSGGDMSPLKAALAPFDSKCGVKISDALTSPTP
jgi:hypothetical protein